MTNLSPHAQQVFWEFNRAASGKPDDWHYLPAIASALRAAADQVENLFVPSSYHGDSHLIFDRGQVAAAEHLRAIAAELEWFSDDP
jgi:hypothetical protein